MADESFQERTQQATPRRRQKARERGTVARSVDLTSAGIICFGFTALFLLGPYMIGRMQDMLRYTMANAPTIALSDATFRTVMADSIYVFFAAMGPLFIAMIAIGVAMNVLQIGFQISPKAMELKFDRLNAMANLKRLFSLRSAVQLVRDPLKLTVVGIVAYIAIRSEFDSFITLADLSIPQLSATLGRLCLLIGVKIGIAILIIGLLDFLYQRFELDKSLKMSMQEVKDEMKETEGNPEIKARTRQIQRHQARQRMMAAVPTADVVVTNPTHIAVALKYDPSAHGRPDRAGQGSAPARRADQADRPRPRHPGGRRQASGARPLQDVRSR